MMIRVFNHYLHRQTVLRIAFDLGFVLLAMVVALAVLSGGVSATMPVVGTHVVSLVAGMFVINTASGFYQASPNLTASQAWARAGMALMFALPLTWGVFSLLPATVENRVAITLVAMIGVAAVTLRRVYVTQSATGRRTGSRILVYGAGPSARLVGETLRQFDPHAKVVGYLPGANEKDFDVPESERLTTSWPLKPSHYTQL